jgi:hypothetical protein
MCKTPGCKPAVHLGIFSQKGGIVMANFFWKIKAAALAGPYINYLPMRRQKNGQKWFYPVKKRQAILSG